MRLIDMVRNSERRLAVPLAGYPGTQLTHSTVKQNEFNAELQARTLYKLVERTQCDAIFTMMDLSVEAGAVGLPVRFPVDDSATIEWHPVKNVADLDQYKVVEPMYDGRVWVFLETIRILKRKLNIPVMAYVIGPFTLAGLMMGANDIAISTLDKPNLVHATVNFAEHTVIDFSKALVEAGADAICILAPTCVMLSPDGFNEFAVPTLSNTVRHLSVPTILHICGNTMHLLKGMCSTGIQGLSLDSLVDMPEAMKRIPGDVVMIGNLCPTAAILNGTTDDVRRDTNKMLDSMAAYENFIASTGCDLPANTPIENIAEFVRTVKGWTK